MRGAILKATLGAWLALGAGPALAGPFNLNYGGRLTGADGAPIAGPVNLKLRFFDAATAGNQLGADVDAAAVALIDGVFTVPVTLDGAQAQLIFSSPSVYVEVTDETNKRTYPRQTFAAVPYAMRVPVDGNTIAYDNNGLLTVPQPAAVATAGPTQSGYLSNSNWVQFNGAPQKSYVDALNAAQLANVAGLSTSLSTGLAGAAANITGLSAGLAASNANIAALSTGLAADVTNVAALSTGLTTTNANLTTTNTNLTTTNTNLTALNNAALKKDGSVALTGPWNVGNQDVTNTGNLLMAGSKVFGLSVATSDPANLTAGDIGKIWYNGGIKLWNGASAQSLGIAGAGLMSINSLNSGTQTLSNAVTGTTPAWNSAGSTHTLNIPMASAGGTVTAGLISNGEWVLFNGKQNVLPAANAVTNGYLASSDWATFNGKDPYVLAGSTTQYYRGDKSWQTLNTGGVAETTNLYFTTARAQAAVTAEPPVVAGTTSQYYRGDKTWQAFPTSASATTGYLASSDWLAFNGKQPNLGYTPVNKAGDTMAGALALPANGLSVGTGQLTVALGNVGIGTTFPQAPLHVNSDTRSVAWLTTQNATSFLGSLFAGIRARGTGASPAAVQNNDALATFAGQGYDGSALGNAASIETDVDGAVSSGIIPGRLTFNTTSSTGTNAERMRITSSGFVGIATTNPEQPLHALGGILVSGTNARFTMGRTDGTDPASSKTWNFDNTANDFRLFQQPTLAAAGTVYMVVRDGGNVGIGTTAPASALTVVGNITTPTQVAFEAKLCSATINPGSDVVWETVVTNIGNAYNNANGTFTAPIAGTYMFGFNALLPFAPSGEFRVEFFKNGVINDGVIVTKPSTSVWETIQGTIAIYMNANDTMKINYSSGSGSLYSDCNYDKFWGRLAG